jgi:hypothetical protein
MQIDFINSGLDIIEGAVAGGILGIASYVIMGAVASLPSSFLSTSVVAPLSVIVGAMGFIGYALPKIRSRLQ